MAAREPNTTLAFPQTPFITSSADGNWTFPTGAVWIKHFELEMTNGAEASRRRVETRFLVKNAAGVHGLTYRWMTPPTNAALVSIPREENFVIHDGGTTRTQVWHYPSPSECLQCHSPSAGHILGFRTAQLNREIDFGGSTSNQLEWVAGTSIPRCPRCTLCGACSTRPTTRSA